MRGLLQGAQLFRRGRELGMIRHSRHKGIAHHALARERLHPHAAEEIAPLRERGVEAVAVQRLPAVGVVEERMPPGDLEGIAAGDDPRAADVPRGPVVGVLEQGDICCVTEIENEWGYVNKMGWISLDPDYSKRISSFTGKVTAGLLNVRQKATKESEVLKTIKKGVTVKITKLNEKGTWGYDSKTKGWVSLKFIKY